MDPTRRQPAKPLTTTSIASIVTATSRKGVDGDDEHLAIDFEKLYHEEKRKLKEQRLLRRMQLQKPTSSNRDINEDNNDSTIHHDRNLTTTTWDVPNWTWESSEALSVSPPSITASSSSTTISTFVPNMIHYEKDFVVNSSYRDALIQWLYQLPENDLSSSSSSFRSNHHHQHHDTKHGNSMTIDPATVAANGKWTVLPHAQRRVALFDAAVHLQQQQQQQQNVFPPPIQTLIDALISAGVYDSSSSTSSEHHLPNHVLINEYVHAHQGILPHTDGPAYHPKTITISFGIGPVLMHFTPMMNHDDHPNKNDNENQEFQMVLHGDGSLIIFENDAYIKYYHSIHDLSSSSFPPNHTTDTITTHHNENRFEANTAAATATMEWTGPNCFNAEPGTCIVRQPNRISITIRHKLE